MEPALIGDLIQAKFTTQQQPISSEITDESGRSAEEILAERLEEFRSRPEIQMVLKSHRPSPEAFKALQTTLQSTTRFDAAMARFWARRIAPEFHEAWRAEHDAEAKRRDEEASKALKLEQQQSVNGRWREFADRFAMARLDRLESRGTTEEQQRQARVWSQIRELDLSDEVKEGRNFLFIGPAGGGKTHLMFAMARGVFGSHKLQFRNGAAMRAEYRKAAMESALAESDLTRSLVEADLLILDDPVPPGDAELKDTQIDFLYRIVNGRYVANRATWAAMNLPIETAGTEAARVLSSPVWDRLRSNATIVQCNWSSFRTINRVIK